MAQGAKADAYKGQNTHGFRTIYQPESFEVHGFSWGEKDKNTKKKGLVNSFLEKYFADLCLEGIRKTRFALGKDTNGR